MGMGMSGIMLEVGWIGQRGRNRLITMIRSVKSRSGVGTVSEDFDGMYANRM
jgi:hypothetical protein